MVAHVLQLAEVVRRYEHRHALLRHILHDKRPHLPPHHGVEAVHRLIEHEYLRPRRKCDPEGRLLLHAARKAADGARIVKREDLAQLFVAFGVEAGIERARKFHKIARRARGGEIRLVRDAEHARLDRGVFKYRFPVEQHRARVLPQHAHYVTDGGRLARAVRTDETVDRAGRHREIQRVERFEAFVDLCNVFQFNARHGRRLRSYL